MVISIGVMKICVTGSSGRAGRAVVADLAEHGHNVLGVDLVPPRGEDGPQDFLRADLTDYGQAVEVLQGMDAVVHLANIPAPGLRTPSVTFNDNMTMNFNVFQAAGETGLRRVVWASSETTLGLPFSAPPRYAPVDEDHYPLPTSTYALSKVASETIATEIATLVGNPVRRAALLEHPWASRLHAIPVLLGRSRDSEVESVELHRRARCRTSLPPGARR